VLGDILVKTAAGFDRARMQAAGGIASSVPTAPAGQKLTPDVLAQMKQQQGVTGAYRGSPEVARTLAQRRMQGQVAAANTYGVYKKGSEKVAFLPAVGAGLMAAGRAALPWLGRAVASPFMKSVGSGVAQQGLAAGAQKLMTPSRPPQQSQPMSIGQV
jgi:hypothetical protein